MRSGVAILAAAFGLFAFSPEVLAQTVGESQESDIPRGAAGNPDESSAPNLSLGVMIGIMPNAVDFEALTSQGVRKLDPGTMGLIRMELASDFHDPFFARVSFEFGVGEDVEVFSGGLDLGIRLLSSELFAMKFDVDAAAGFMISELRVDISDFGGFNSAVGLRGGMGSHLALSERFSLDVSVNFRDISYEWSGDIVSGDHRALIHAVDLVFGITWRF